MGLRGGLARVGQLVAQSPRGEVVTAQAARDKMEKKTDPPRGRASDLYAPPVGTAGLHGILVRRLPRLRSLHLNGSSKPCLSKAAGELIEPLYANEGRGNTISQAISGAVAALRSLLIWGYALACG